MTTPIESLQPITAPFHYFASSSLYWVVADTQEVVLSKIAATVGASDIRKALPNGGYYVWTCRVHLPRDARYSIEWFRPSKLHDESRTPVEISNAKHWVLLTSKGVAVQLADDFQTCNAPNR